LVMTIIPMDTAFCFSALQAVTFSVVSQTPQALRELHAQILNLIARIDKVDALSNTLGELFGRLSRSRGMVLAKRARSH